MQEGKDHHSQLDVLLLALAVELGQLGPQAIPGFCLIRRRKLVEIPVVASLELSKAEIEPVEQVGVAEQEKLGPGRVDPLERLLPRQIHVTLNVVEVVDVDEHADVGLHLEHHARGK